MQGNRKSVTDVAKKALLHVNNRHNWHSWHNSEVQIAISADTDGYQLIENTVKNLWDGNPTTAEFIASFIQALRPALALAISALGSHQKGGGT